MKLLLRSPALASKNMHLWACCNLQHALFIAFCSGRGVEGAAPYKALPNDCPKSGIPKGEAVHLLVAEFLYSLSPLVVGKVRETYETFPGGSLHTFSPERKYDHSPIQYII